MKKLFHFFGSIHFAISLIATTAFFVVAGTLIESWADSHQYAAALTYEHPAFFVLLFFFFVNILFSALRRWPFQKKHIPFLITHLGLLMMITGVFVKSLYGLQGVMTLVEGTGTDQVLIPNSKAVRIEDRNRQIAYHSLDDRNAPFQMMGYAPHSKESYDYWIKGNTAYIQGLPPFPVVKWDGGEVPVSGKTKFTNGEIWDLVALRVKSPEKAAAALYQQGLDQGEVDLDYHFSEGPRSPVVTIEGTIIALNGDQQLVNDEGIDIDRTPTLALMQDERDDTHLFFFDRHGRVFYQKYPGSQLSTLAVYDEGFGGYSAIAEIPHFTQSRVDIQELTLSTLREELKTVDPADLAPPLKFIQQQAGVEYAKIIVDLFQNWHQSEKADIPPINWDDIDQQVLRGLQWAAQYFAEGGSMEEWPVEIPRTTKSEQQTFLVQQLISIGDQLPPLPSSNHAALLKTYLLAFGITPSAVSPPYHAMGVQPEMISLESPLTFRHKVQAAEKNRENNRPLTTLNFEEGGSVTVGYDSTGSGICRPVCEGKYLVRFQPDVKTIPYRVRLRNARQITYANSEQPFSYEADIYINGMRKKLSMNHVHETWDGYRFYLSSISPSDESSVKRVQLIVNRDPAKYFLTYPGGSFVSLGILLLFWWRPKNK